MEQIEKYLITTTKGENMDQDQIKQNIAALKAKAYDLVISLQATQAQLNNTQNEIYQLSQELQKQPAASGE